MAKSVESRSYRPRALLVVPIAPAPTGNGLAMRAAVTVQGLARTCNLTTVVVPVSDPAADARSLEWVSGQSADCALILLPDPAEAARRWLASADGRAAVAATQPLPDRARLACPGVIPDGMVDGVIDLVWVMRLYMAGAALPYRRQKTRLVLDLDEDDAATLRSIAALHDRRGETNAAARLAEHAAAYERLTAHVRGWFDQLVTASEPETAALRQRQASATVTTIPNAVALPATKRHERRATKAPSLLFVGNLDYLPNRDAAERLAASILPAVRRQVPNAELHLIGAGRTTNQIATPGAHAHGFVDDLEPFYDRARLTVVPLRAGGGSRLKILEAFARGLPVVASTVAAAGLAVTDDDQLLIADDDEALVAATLRIVADDSLAQRLATSARRFVATHHDADRIASRIADLARGPGANGAAAC